MANGLDFAIRTAYKDALKSIEDKDMDNAEELFKAYADLVDSKNKLNAQELGITVIVKDFWENKFLNRNQ
tara:strand:+ start:747 stop:956 length:210 start_codon:yes stop_codon:yes gene_type:complete